MSVAAIETRRSILLTGWCVLAAIVLALVIYGVFDRLLRLNLPAGPLELLIFRG